MSVRQLGRGIDHLALEIDGDLVARIATSQADRRSEQVAREARLLDLLAKLLPVAVPKVVASDPRAGLLVVTKIHGSSLLDRPSPDPQDLVPALAGVLGTLHGIPQALTSGIVDLDDTPPSAWLEEAMAVYTRVAQRLDRAERLTVERFLARPPPPPAREHVLCHNDLGAEHLIVDGDDSLVGIIDWSDGALADAAVDLGRLGRDLGPSVATRIATELGLHDTAIHRAAFYACCTLLEDLDHGFASGDRRYCDAALAHLARTFNWGAP